MGMGYEDLIGTAWEDNRIQADCIDLDSFWINLSYPKTLLLLSLSRPRQKPIKW